MDSIDSVDKYLASSEQPLITSNARFFGFINDVGEALHSFLPKPIYLGTYAITAAYAVGAVYYDRRALANVLDKTQPPLSGDEKSKRLDARTFDNTCWHALATVAITPLVVIPAIKVGAKRFFVRLNIGSLTMNEKILPATIAILAIPAVVSPVDNAVTYGFNIVREKPEPYHWTGYWEHLNDHHAEHTATKEMK